MARDKTSAAIVRADGVETILVSPSVGLFRSRIASGGVIREGDLIGTLETVGVVQMVVAPSGAFGRWEPRASDVAARPVSYGGELGRVTAIEGASAVAASSEAARERAGGLVVRAPTSGRFYARPAPGKPVFVEIGSIVEAGATIGLLEVMKTFHRVRYDAVGTGLPERAKIADVLVADESDVAQGDALVRVEPA